MAPIHLNMPPTLYSDGNWGQGHNDKHGSLVRNTGS